MKILSMTIIAAAFAVGATAFASPVSKWYCVSESPGNMQSSGHIGTAEAATQAEAASQAVANCKLDGGDLCQAPQCFPENGSVKGCHGDIECPIHYRCDAEGSYWTEGHCWK